VTFFCAIFAGVAGVGGGAIYMPVYILIFNDSKLFIPLAKATVLGVAIAYNVQNVFRHRETSFPGIKRSLIAYDLSLVLEPMTLIGTIFGARLNKMVPYYINSAVMLLFGFFIAQKTWNKGRKRQRTEDIDKAESSQILLLNAEENIKALWDPAICGNKLIWEQIAATLPTKQCPGGKIFGLFFAWATVMVTTVLSAGIGSGGPSAVGLVCGTFQYWAVVLSPIPILCLITFMSIHYEVRRTRRLEELGYPFECSDVKYSFPTMLKISVVCIIAGVMSGCIGLGGSTIKGPFLHFLIGDASVSKATSCYMLLSTASSSMVIFIWLGLLNATQAILFVMIGFIGGLIGANIMNTVVKRLGRKSIIIYALAIYIFLGMMMMFVLSLIKNIGDFKRINPDDYASTAFHGLCQHYFQTSQFW